MVYLRVSLNAVELEEDFHQAFHHAKFDILPGKIVSCSKILIQLFPWNRTHTRSTLSEGQDIPLVKVRPNLGEGVTQTRDSRSVYLLLLTHEMRAMALYSSR